MRVFYGSDLHIEFGPAPAVPTGDLLLLAGDIFTPYKMEPINVREAKAFFSQCSKNFTEVLYVMGNHEHYGGFLYETNGLVREFLKEFPNIKVLDNEFVEYDDFMVYGATFWTDCRDSNPEVVWNLHRNMNDFSEIATSRDTIYGGSCKLRCPDIISENFYTRKKMAEFVKECEAKEKMAVFLTHHNPSMFCTPDEFKLDLLSYGYSNTGLDDFVLDLEDYIWVCGHQHEPLSAQFGNGIILRNPRGYFGIDNGGEYKFKAFDVIFTENNDE